VQNIFTNRLPSLRDIYCTVNGFKS